MRKIFIIIVAALVSCLALSAKQLTPGQQKAKADIFNALKQYATNVSDVDDETIEFQYDGAKYQAAIHKLNAQTLYLWLSVGYGLPENEYRPEIANIAALLAAGGKPVCSIAVDGALAFSCEMYAKDARPFIAVLPEMLHALSSSVENFQAEYEKVEKQYSPTSSSKPDSRESVSIDDKYLYPSVATPSDSKLYITSVDLNSDYTILNMVSYNGAKFMNCTIDPNSYLMAGGKKYNLIKAKGIDYAPKCTDYPDCQSGREVSLNFKLYFPPLPKGTTTFDFIENTTDGWQLKGVELKHGQRHVVTGETVETPSHRWTCTAIEVQNGQTIVIKTVQPKSAGTYMFSSQDEFIEDAETGRRYYLRNSSLGFEGSPAISHDTETVCFWEVYPALPLSVKKINISTGTKYYVKGLKIR